MKEDTQRTIGKKLTDENHRDAIHIAVLPVSCALGPLSAGQKVKFAYGTKSSVSAAAPEEWGIGIVDPFLSEQVETGERFWLFVRPNSVSGMRHEWTHPEVDALPDLATSESEKWLRQFALDWNFDWDELISEAMHPSKDPYRRVVVAHGRDLHSSGELGEDYNRFWMHLEKFTGQHFDEERREALVWSCSC